MILLETPLNEWYAFSVSDNNRFVLAEQAINAIYLLASQPDVVCGNILKKKTRDAFHHGLEPALDAEDEPNGEIVRDGSTSSRGLSSVRSLSQLLFIVGHVASMATKLATLTLVKQIIHIELCEAEFKRRKAELEKGNTLTLNSITASS
jgi:condensin complex subunit 1